MSHLDHALRLAEVGISVLPSSQYKEPSYRHDRGGTPILLPWDRYKQQIASEPTIRAWFQNGALLAIVCGAVSGNVEGIDFDNKGNPDAETLYREWCALVDKEAPGLVARLYGEHTQSKGYHVVYRCEEPVGNNQKLARRPATSDEITRDPTKKFETLIETRGEGGYLVIAPSQGYTQFQGALDDLPVITATERAILLNAARALNRYVEQHHTVNTTRELSSWRGRPDLPSGEGVADLYNTKFGDETIDLLSRARWAVDAVRGETLYLRRPDKAHGTSATLGHVAPNVLYVFSSNASPFEGDHGYSPFAVYALLTHDGDFKGATKAAAERLGVDYASNPQQPTFIDSVPYCPNCEKRLTPTTTDWWKCETQVSDRKVCFWWEGGGYTVPSAQGDADAGGLTPGSAPALAVEALQRRGYAFRRNTMTDTITVNGLPMDDTLEARILTELYSDGFKSAVMLSNVITRLASEDAHHPVRDWLSELVWNKRNSIGQLTTCLHSSDTPVSYPNGETRSLTAVYLTKFLVGAVDRAYTGTQNMMLVLSGEQGIGKSQLARWLGSGVPEAFYEGPITPGDKDCLILQSSKWLWEVSELDATTRRADVSALKDFITLRYRTENMS